MKRTLLFILAMLSLCNLVQAEDHGGFLEFSLVSRQHNYDFDVTINGTQFKVDEKFSAGYRARAGWSFGSRWDVFVDYTGHDNDNTDGVIVEPGNRVQAPITYKYDRVQLGVENHFPLSDRIWLDTSVAYQKVRQGIGDFFVSTGNNSFGLDTSTQNNGWNGEIGLRLANGRWQYSAVAGYDPHAGFELGTDGVVVESSAYGRLGFDYQFADSWKAGINLSQGKVTEASVTIGLMF